ncbi:lysozyme inhibitor LprI family protein [Paraferrimonas sp. SM1919]|uniref:lysozyme inhibitor LprI family protein n=1 Tax=Paraferrimonas sp. SM1919 TaxID=2662263 RepID=UPI0013D8D077|nr:lysozyme inhibitor LprI family protein [Paraferrimonas sp. SM1919]
MRKTITTFIAITFFISISAVAVDNPDAPDRIGDFEIRMTPYISKINNAKSTLNTIETYYEYEKALDKELNTAYSFLIGKLKGESKIALRNSQRQWIKYRNEEFSFIEENWTRARSGSSFALSRGAYKTSFIKQRVIQLLSYSANYL